MNLSNAASVKTVSPVLFNGQITPTVRAILEKSLMGEELNVEDACVLFATQGLEAQAVLDTADKVREKRVGNTGTFVITRNINLFNNFCVSKT